MAVARGRREEGRESGSGFKGHEVSGLQDERSPGDGR